MSETRPRDPRKSNPFTPVFGKVPPYFAGRESIIDNMTSVFESPDNNPDRCTLFVGARGTGKTALITHLAHIAEQSGWISANVTASDTMLEDILQQTQRAASHLVDVQEHRNVASVGIAGIGNISWTSPSKQPPSWRAAMSDVLDKLAEKDCGLLITVDEVDPNIEAMEQLVTTYQHFVREDRKVALFMAGLPHRINALVSGESTSFLRRAARYQLGSIPSYEVKEAFRLTVESGGKEIAEEPMNLAVDAIDGFPYLFQLVGYRSWNSANGNASIESLDVQRGSALAHEELASRIFDASYRELSPNDRAFLAAMAQDDDVTTRSDLMDRLHKPGSHISAYKKRLMERGVIEETPRGDFRFALPGFREYIREMEGMSE